MPDNSNFQTRSVLIGLLFWIVLVVFFKGSLLRQRADYGTREGITSDTAIHPDNRWDSHVYIFVGGTHGSGTTVTERLLSSQSFASGLQINDRVVSNTRSCMYISRNLEKSCVRLVFT